jgi:hypothetical protein
VKLRYGWLLAAALLWTGCGKEERREAVALAKVLTQKTAELTATNALEKDLLGSTREWAAGITTNGAGHGSQLDENATSATALSQSAAVVSVQLGQLRQAVYDLPLKQEYPREVRSTLINQLQKRQKMLQDVRTALDACTANFHEFRQSRTYTGDTYPAGIDKLNSMLGGYTGPEDLLAKAIADLKAKYKLQDADLVG